MIDSNYDPYEVLQHLQLASMSQEHEVGELKSQVERQSHLMELMATQVKHLTNAVIGLQTVNKTLQARLQRLDGDNCD